MTVAFSYGGFSYRSWWVGDQATKDELVEAIARNSNISVADARVVVEAVIVASTAKQNKLSMQTSLASSHEEAHRYIDALVTDPAFSALQQTRATLYTHIDAEDVIIRDTSALHNFTLL